MATSVASAVITTTTPTIRNSPNTDNSNLGVLFGPGGGIPPVHVPFRTRSCSPSSSTSSPHSSSVPPMTNYRSNCSPGSPSVSSQSPSPSSSDFQMNPPGHPFRLSSHHTPSSPSVLLPHHADHPSMHPQQHPHGYSPAPSPQPQSGYHFGMMVPPPSVMEPMSFHSQQTNNYQPSHYVRHHSYHDESSMQSTSSGASTPSLMGPPSGPGSVHREHGTTFSRDIRNIRNQAEKQRRDKLNGYINDLASIVPFITQSKKRQDKTSILRLSAAYIRFSYLTKKWRRGPKGPICPTNSNQHYHPQQNGHYTTQSPGNSGSSSSSSSCGSSPSLPDIFGDLSLSSERKLSAQTIHASLVDTMDSLPGFSLITNCQGKILFVTPAIEKFLGHQDTEVVGNSLQQFLHPSDAESVLSMINASLKQVMDGAKESDRISFECRLKEKNQPRAESTVWRTVRVSGHITAEFSDNDLITDELPPRNYNQPATNQTTPPPPPPTPTVPHEALMRSYSFSGSSHIEIASAAGGGHFVEPPPPPPPSPIGPNGYNHAGQYHQPHGQIPKYAQHGGTKMAPQRSHSFSGPNASMQRSHSFSGCGPEGERYYAEPPPQQPRPAPVYRNSRYRGPNPDVAPRYEHPPAPKSLSLSNMIFLCFVEVVHADPQNELKLVDASFDEYISRHSLDGTLLYADHRISSVIGFFPTEVYGKSAYDYIIPDDYSIALFAHKLMLNNSCGTGVVVHRLRSVDGSAVFLQTAGCLQYNSTGQIDHFMCVSRMLKETEGEKERVNFVKRFTPHIHNKTPVDLYESLQLCINPFSTGFATFATDPAVQLATPSPAAIAIASAINPLEHANRLLPARISRLLENKSLMGLPTGAIATKIMQSQISGQPVDAPKAMELFNQMTVQAAIKHLEENTEILMARAEQHHRDHQQQLEKQQQKNREEAAAAAAQTEDTEVKRRATMDPGILQPPPNADEYRTFRKNASRKRSDSEAYLEAPPNKKGKLTNQNTFIRSYTPTSSGASKSDRPNFDCKIEDGVEIEIPNKPLGPIAIRPPSNYVPGAPKYELAQGQCDFTHLLGARVLTYDNEHQTKVLTIYTPQEAIDARQRGTLLTAGPSASQPQQQQQTKTQQQSHQTEAKKEKKREERQKESLLQVIDTRYEHRVEPNPRESKVPQRGESIEPSTPAPEQPYQHHHHHVYATKSTAQPQPQPPSHRPSSSTSLNCLSNSTLHQPNQNHGTASSMIQKAATILAAKKTSEIVGANVVEQNNGGAPGNYYHHHHHFYGGPSGSTAGFPASTNTVSSSMLTIKSDDDEDDSNQELMLLNPSQTVDVEEIIETDSDEEEASRVVSRTKRRNRSRSNQRAHFGRVRQRHDSFQVPTTPVLTEQPISSTVGHLVPNEDAESDDIVLLEEITSANTVTLHDHDLAELQQHHHHHHHHHHLHHVMHLPGDGRDGSNCSPGCNPQSGSTTIISSSTTSSSTVSPLGDDVDLGDGPDGDGLIDSSAEVSYDLMQLPINQPSAIITSTTMDHHHQFGHSNRSPASVLPVHFGPIGKVARPLRPSPSPNHPHFTLPQVKSRLSQQAASNASTPEEVIKLEDDDDEEDAESPTNAKHNPKKKYYHHHHESQRNAFHKVIDQNSNSADHLSSIMVTTSGSTGATTGTSSSSTTAGRERSIGSGQMAPSYGGHGDTNNKYNNQHYQSYGSNQTQGYSGGRSFNQDSWFEPYQAPSRPVPQHAPQPSGSATQSAELINLDFFDDFYEFGPDSNQVAGIRFGEAGGNNGAAGGGVSFAHQQQQARSMYEQDHSHRKEAIILPQLVDELESSIDFSMLTDLLIRDYGAIIPAVSSGKNSYGGHLESSKLVDHMSFDFLEASLESSTILPNMANNACANDVQLFPSMVVANNNNNAPNMGDTSSGVVTTEQVASMTSAMITTNSNMSTYQNCHNHRNQHNHHQCCQSIIKSPNKSDVNQFDDAFGQLEEDTTSDQTAPNQTPSYL